MIARTFRLGEDATPLTQEFETDCVAGVRGLELGNVALQNASPTKSLGCQNCSGKARSSAENMRICGRDWFAPPHCGH
jgi:hypothetical protein